MNGCTTTWSETADAGPETPSRFTIITATELTEILQDEAFPTMAGPAARRPNKGNTKIFVSAEELTDLFSRTKSLKYHDRDPLPIASASPVRPELLFDPVDRERPIVGMQTRDKKPSKTLDGGTLEFGRELPTMASLGLSYTQNRQPNAEVSERNPFKGLKDTRSKTPAETKRNHSSGEAMWRNGKTTDEHGLVRYESWLVLVRKTYPDRNNTERFCDVTTERSDHDLMQYRGFAYLHARLLLRLQYDIVELEKELDEIDEFDERGDYGAKRKLFCMSRDLDEGVPGDIAGFLFRRGRPQVFEALRKQLLEYDDLLLKSKRMSLLQKPSARDWESVRDWIMDNKPLVNEEQDFILRKEDIVTLHTGREGAMFEGLVICRIIRRIFLTPELQFKTSNKLVDYYAPSRINTLFNTIVVATIFTLLVLPIIALYRLSDVGTGASALKAIGLPIVFTLLFGAAMSGMIKASRQELFAASAAYCAVLVVFISNYQTQTVSIVNWDQAK
ncbi:hypothetical protein B0A48_16147 [Cryoendolithus antarcticus]|uniref:DUF6594 domain-containing protein n=1 Tax=Cryoendolithus antarcticus TaxID=1507870 RepID=A0A1V8SFN3_9PEZI|nr:hypothetical protein B0A48_16147 [Cryoendolithus antarcticus]